MYFLLKTLVSALMIATISEVARRFPATGALIASLPLVSIMGMMWLWHDTHDREKMALHAGATFWYVLPSLPMFLLIPVLLRHGWPFWAALGAGCVVTVGLYLLLMAAAPRLGLRI